MKDIHSQIDSFCFFVKQANKEADIDLSETESFTLSGVMRQLNKQCSEKEIEQFLKIYFNNFNELTDTDKDFEKKCLVLSLKDFSKIVAIKKQAATEPPDVIADNLINIIHLLVTKIKSENQSKAIASIKQKLSTVSINDLATKNMPASSAIGQSISFVKQILFDKDPAYIKTILTKVIQKL